MFDYTKVASAPGRLKHHDVTEKIIGAFYDVYNELGHGFLESVYHEALSIALVELGCTVLRETPIPVFFHDKKVGQFFADMLVNGVVLVELKTVAALDRSHYAQLTHYLKATEIEVGLLLNFGPKPSFKRLLLDNAQKRIRVHPCESVVGV